MNTKGLVGYILSLVGIVGLASSVVPKIKEKVFGFLPDSVVAMVGTSLLVISLVLLGVGVAIVFVSKKGSRKHGHSSEEVPIYQGGTIVGYRRN